MSDPQHRMIITTTLGTLIEWAEFAFFAYMADQLSSLFFAPQSASIARLKTYCIFGASYFMRPIGAVIFGSLGDKWGRKPTLLASMVLMGLATLSIGCLPTYAEIGSLSAGLLVICRLLQGLAVAGEFHGAATFLHEHNEKHPYFFNSFAPFAAGGGMALGAMAATLTQLPGMPMWSWRLPFFCSGLLCILALYLRQHVDETPSFKLARQQKKLHRFPLWVVLREQKRGLFLTLGLSLFIAVFVYIGNIYYKVTAIQVGGLSNSLAATAITFGQMTAAILTLVFGFVLKPHNIRQFCLTGLCLAVLIGPGLFFMAGSGHVFATFVGQGMYAITNSLVASTMMTLILQQFPTETRYSGNALGWNIGSALFGGTALMVAEMLSNQLQIAWAPGVYISVASLISGCLVYFLSRHQEEEALDDRYVLVTFNDAEIPNDKARSSAF